jgi:hypothetical protein
VGSGACAFVVSVAGGAWADDIANPPAQPSQANPTEQPSGMTPPAQQQQQLPQPQTAPTAPTEQGQPATGNAQNAESASLTTESSATVSAIDRPDRKVTLKDPAGEKFVVAVPKDVKAFDTLKTGDKIDIDYRASVALSILPPGAKPSETERAAAMSGGGAGAMGKALTITANVVNVDTEGNQVTFKGPHGMNRTVKVQDPELQKKLPDLKAGDSVKLTFTEATAADIRPAASTK